RSPRLQGVLPSRLTVRGRFRTIESGVARPTIRASCVHRMRLHATNAARNADGESGLRCGGDVAFGGDHFARFLQRHDEVHQTGNQLTLAAHAGIELVGGHAAVGHVALAVDFEHALLVHAFEQVAHAGDDHLMADDQHALAAVAAGDGVEHAAQPQDDVAPAFAAGRAEIELAHVHALLVQFRILELDAGNGEPVDDAELLFPQAFVDV